MIGTGDRVSDPVGSGLVLALAMAFFVTGCSLLVITGPSLGALHAFAAFIILAILAALNQLLPVLTNAPVARPQLVISIALGFATGFALLILAFYGLPTFLAAAIVLGASALVWVVWNIIRLIVGRGESQTRSLMACAILAFAIAAGLGTSMAGSFSGAWAAPVAALAPLHATLAIVGFASLLILAVSYRFVPMFAVAHGTAYGRRLMQWLAVAGAAVVAIFVHAAVGFRLGIMALLIAAVLIGMSHMQTLRLRLRKRLDVSLRYGSVAWGFAILALIATLASSWQSRFGLPAVILAVLGWICISILGYAYKVAGFLAWQAAKDRDPRAQLPALSTAVNLPLAYVALTLISVGSATAAVFAYISPDRMQVGLDIYAGGGLCAVVAVVGLGSSYVFRKETDAHATRATG